MFGYSRSFCRQLEMDHQAPSLPSVSWPPKTLVRLKRITGVKWVSGPSSSLSSNKMDLFLHTSYKLTGLIASKSGLEKRNRDACCCSVYIVEKKSIERIYWKWRSPLASPGRLGQCPAGLSSNIVVNPVFFYCCWHDKCPFLFSTYRVVPTRMSGSSVSACTASSNRSGMWLARTHWLVRSVMAARPEVMTTAVLAQAEVVANPCASARWLDSTGPLSLRLSL